MRITCLVVLLLATVAHAQPVGTTRVAVVDTATLFSPSGVARYRAALAQLDAEKATFKPAEHPTGKRQPPVTMPPIDGLPEKQREELKRKIEEIERQSAKRDAWSSHVEATLTPIKEDVSRALAQFAQSKGIGLVLERYAGGAIVVMAPETDITAAFIKHYDAKKR